MRMQPLWPPVGGAETGRAGGAAVRGGRDRDLGGLQLERSDAALTRTVTETDNVLATTPKKELPAELREKVAVHEKREQVEARGSREEVRQ